MYVFSLFQTFRVVPHGTKGTGPGFVTRPVYLRSQFRNNTNTVSTLVLLIHLLQVLCTRYVGNAHHRALQTSGRGWADSKVVHGMECSGAHSLCWRSLSQQGLLPVVYRTASTGRCAHLHDRTIDKEQTKNQRPRVPCTLVVYIAGDALRHQPMGADHMTVLQLRGPMGFRILPWWLYITGDTLRHQPMGAGHMTVLQLRGLYGIPCPAMVSPNAS